MSIDSRIVEMKFDNAEFERNARTSMETLKNLDNRLQMEDGVKGMAKVADAVSNVSLAPLAAGIEEVSGKFSAMEVAAITVISNITNSVMNAAKHVADALLIEPITTGMNEYEQKMDNVQTTMINSGRSLEEVNKTLDELNHYADKTIFKFSDMTSALSKFTMAGVTDLNLASTMVEGIGNIAGESGLKTEQASSAFYMISQAMSAGNMALYQWRTLETTGFASRKFRENLLETAVAMGKIEKLQNGMYRAAGVDDDFDAGSMRNSLTKGKWFDSELMQTIFARYASPEASKALSEATGQAFEDISEAAFHAAQDIKTFTQMFDTLKEAAQSGWAETWQIIVGDYEEAKTLWTAVNNVISGILDRQSDVRNTVLSEWKDTGGRLFLIEGFKVAWNKLSVVVNAVKSAIKDVFPPITGKRLTELSAKIYMLADKIPDLTKKTANITLITRSAAEIVKKVIDNIKSLFSTFKQGFKDASPKFKSLTDELNKFLDKARLVSANMQTFAKNLVISERASSFFKMLGGIFGDLFTIAVDLGKAIGGALGIFKDASLEGPKDILFSLVEGVKNLLDNFVAWEQENEVFSKIFNGIAKGFTAITDVLTKVTSFIEDKFGPVWKNFKESLRDFFTKEDEDNMTVLDKIWSGLGKVIEFVGNILSKVFPVLSKVAHFFGNIVGAIFDGLNDFLVSMSGDEIAKGVTAMNVGFASLLGAQGIWKVSDGFGDIWSVVKSLIDVVNKGLDSLINFGDILDGFSELKTAAVFDLRVDSLKKVAISLALIAASLFLLSKADPVMVGVSLGALAVGLTKVMGVLEGANLFNKANPNGGTKGMFIMTTMLLEIAGAVLILAIAMRILASADPLNLMAAMLAISALFTGIGILMKSLVKTMDSLTPFIQNPKVIKQVGKFMEQLAAGLLIMAVAIKILSGIPPEGLVAGTVVVLALMTAIVVFVKALPIEKMGQMGAFAASILVISLAMISLAAAIKIIGSMSLESAFLGVTVIAGILFAFVVIADKVTKETGKLIAFSAAIAIFSVALVIIAAAFKILETLNWEKALPGMIGIGAFIALLAMASTIIEPAKMLALSGAMLVLSVSLIAIAGALMLLQTMSVGRIAATLGILTGFLAVFVILSVALSGVPLVLVAMASLTNILMGLGISLALVGAGIFLIGAGLEMISIAAPTAMAGLVLMITELISLIPTIATMLAAGFVAFVSGIAEGATTIVESLVKIGVSIIDGLIVLIPKIIELMTVLLTAVGDWLIEYMPAIVEWIGTFIVTLLGVIIPAIENWWTNKVLPFIKGKALLIKAKFDIWKRDTLDAGRNFIQGFIDGVKEKIQAAYDAVVEFGGKIIDKLKGVFDEHSPSKVTYGIGEFFNMGFANAVREKAYIAEQAAEDMGRSTLNGFKAVISRVSDAISSDDYAPTITPVLDLSAVEEGTRSLSSMLSRQNGGSISTSVTGRLTSISGNVATAGGAKVITNHYDMIQNNYSPKALSRYDIYRQTENQFSRLKGVIST